MITTVSRDLGEGRILTLETGRVAHQAGGSVIVRLGDTMVLATATVSPEARKNIDFFPLLVDFEEKLYAAGKIPGGFFRREGRPTEKAILTARLIDRPIRSLFPKGMRNDVQIVVTPLSVDQENPPDILAMIGASAALLISDIPFEIPVSAVRVGKIGNQFVAHPTNSQLNEGVLDLTVAVAKDQVLMMEAKAQQIPEADVLEAVRVAIANAKIIAELQQELRQKAGRPKITPVIYKTNELIGQWVREKAFEKIKDVMTNPNRDYQKDELVKLTDALKVDVENSGAVELQKANTESPLDIRTTIEEIEKEIVRAMVVKEGRRADGRGLTDIRAIACEVGILPRAHGSGLFARGDTQVLTVATLGAAGEAQKLEGLEDEEEAKKRYMHHYNFPAFSVGEVRPLRGPGRREVGHGALAEKALGPVLPSEANFPYTIRLVSEVLGSNGSTSMASTCGSTLALMDAGVPIAEPVSGISIGLVKENGKEILLTDIVGLEDHLGDMDFKVAGTRNGITAIQLDLKIDGISIDLVGQIFERAREGRLLILDRMKQVIQQPRAGLSPFAPHVVTLVIDPEKIGAVIGPGGKMIRRIQEETGVKIDIEDDGRVFITSPDEKGLASAKHMVEQVTFEPKVGETYTGKITRIMNFGAFVEIAPGKEGLVHVSELSDQRVENVEDEVKIGDELIVKLMEVDSQGRYNLSRRAVLTGASAPAPREGFGDREGRPPRRGFSDRPRTFSRSGPPRSGSSRGFRPHRSPER